MNNNTAASQMELTLKSSNAPRRHGRPQQTRTERAAWWFAKMRHIVDQAITWTAKPATPR